MIDYEDLSIQTPTRWTRRTWLNRNVVAAFGVAQLSRRSLWSIGHPNLAAQSRSERNTQWDDDRDTLVQRAIEAARRAGAQYVDAHATYTTQHGYSFGSTSINDSEKVGIGVRALANGAWGFAARPNGDVTSVERLARQAVTQAMVNARGKRRTPIDLGPPPVAQGTWVTSVQIDPFTVGVEEKLAMIHCWIDCARKVGLSIETVMSELHFTRQERTVATSDNVHFTQITYESGATINVQNVQYQQIIIPVSGVETAGRGWELLLDAKIAEQIQAMPDEFKRLEMLRESGKPAAVGRYTLVCDGATMAALLSATLGTALQVDRALGYEANASGTSFLNDPLAMLGTFKVASPLVTVTANRSAPTQLATVKWDDEGVTPSEMTLVKDGMVTDFQTTREQAAWLAPYYTKHGRSIRSNGCAASESALGITMQHMPNLSLEPGHASIAVDDLIANVKDGILLEQGVVMQIDSQARNGLLFSPRLRKIDNGKLGKTLTNGAVPFNTLDVWRRVTAIGGATTQMVVPFSQYPFGGLIGELLHRPVKGQPAQAVSFSAQAVAATISDQPIVDPLRKI